MEVSAALQRMDLNLLIHLDALLEYRHVTRAAEAIGIGQSAMSAALARLRRVFQDPLLVRNGRVHELTPLGQSLVESVRAVLVAAEQVLATKPHFDPRTDARTFTVVASDYVTLILLRPLLEILYADAPKTTVNVVPVGPTTEVDLAQSRADLVITPGEMASAGMRRFPRQRLYTDRYVAAVWKDHREIAGRLDGDQLQDLHYVRYSSPTNGVAFIDRQLSDLGIYPEIALTTHSFTLVPWLLPGTSLIAFVHERLLHAMPVRRELRVVEFDLPLEPITETMFWHPFFHDDPAHVWLRRRIASLADALQ
jgi:LysR family transcriptional regulator, nod-box dependent transcriptional activator